MRRQAISSALALSAAMLVAAAIPASAVAAEGAAALVPWPRALTSAPGRMELGPRSRIVATDGALVPLSEVLAEEIHMTTGLRLGTVVDDAGAARRATGDIVLKFDRPTPRHKMRREDEDERYRLEVGKSAVVSGAGYVGVAWGTVTLLQAISTDDGRVRLPRMSVEDGPVHAYRSVLLDIARRWHPVETLRETIELLRLYKVRYLHLHLSDNQSCTFPSRAFPKLATPRRSYSPEQMADIVRYADERGVTIIPELDVPAHAGSWTGRLPEVFGTTDPATGRSRGVGIVNMANEKAYDALDTIVGELCETFASSPYIHLGADEVGAGGLKALPEYMPYVKRHGLKEAEAGRVHELFCHFVVRMNEIVRKRGRRMIVWNGFPHRGTANVKVPRDMLVQVWAGSPLPLIESGFEVVNCCWLPLYMVPPQGRAPLPEWVYEWGVRRWNSWGRDIRKPIVAPEDAAVRGAQICYWEQRHEQVSPVLRPRVPALSERLWNPGAGRSYEDFAARREHTDRLVSRINHAVELRAEGLINSNHPDGPNDPNDITFTDALVVRLASETDGVIRCRVGTSYDEIPGRDAPVYTAPIRLTGTAVVSARLYGRDGRPRGQLTQQLYRKIVPSYRYRVMGPTPHPVWAALPDFSTLTELRSGVTGRATRERVAEINRGMFAGVSGDGHVDTRVRGLWNPYAVELTGQVRVPSGGEYSFVVNARDGQAALSFGEVEVGACRTAGSARTTVGRLVQGIYPFRIEHYYRSITNDLNVKVRGPGLDGSVAFDELVVPIARWLPAARLARVPEGETFEAPGRAAFTSLATDKPVRVSGGTEGNMVPANAVDADPGNASGWHAGPGAEPQWLEVDLGRPFSIDRVRAVTYHDGGRYYQYRVDASLDRARWRTVVDMSRNTIRSTPEGREHRFETTRARYVRITMLKNSANPSVHLNELMVFKAESPEAEPLGAAPPPAPPPAAEPGRVGEGTIRPREGELHALRFDSLRRSVVRADAPRGSALRLDSSFTLEAWISLEKIAGYNTDLIGFEGGWRLWLGGHTNILYFDKAGKFGKLRAGEWTHVAVSCDAGGEVRFYIDGEPAPRPVWQRSGPLRTGNKGAFFVGCLTHGPEPRYQGRCAIDEVRLWSACLSAETIRAIHDKALTGKMPGLAAYWGFDEGDGGRAVSCVPGSPEGVLGSMPRGGDFSRQSPPRWVREGAPVIRKPASGEIEVSPPALEFGAWELTRGPTEPKSILIRNASTEDLNVFQVEIGGPDAGAFSVVEDSGVVNLNAGCTRDVRIVFAPPTTGAKAASLIVMSTDPDEGLVRVPLSGDAHCRRPPPPAAGPVPSDGATGMKHWMYLRWTPSPGADEYDVYLWPGPGRRPALPSATAAEARYTPPSYLDRSATYRWQVVSRNRSGSTPGDEWTFSTRAEDPGAPPFDISPSARAERAKLYEVAGRAHLTGPGTPLRNGCRISFFGDSITMQGGYVRNIQKALKEGEGTKGMEVAVFRHGLNGGRVPTVMAGKSPWGKLGGTMQELIDKDKPHVVSIWLGVNDVWHGAKGTTPEEFEAGLRKMVAMCRAAGAKVVLSPLAILKEDAGKWNPKCDRYADITRRAAAATGSTLVDLRLAVKAFMRNEGAELNPDGTLVFRQKLLTYDGVHLNARGCEVVADLIAQGICEALRE